MKTERHDLHGTIVVESYDGRTRIAPSFYASLTKEDCCGNRILLRAWEKKVREAERVEQTQLGL